MKLAADSESDVVSKLLAVHANLTPKMLAATRGGVAPLPPLKASQKGPLGGHVGNREREFDDDIPSPTDSPRGQSSNKGSPTRLPVLRREDTMKSMSPLLEQLKALFEKKHYDPDGSANIGVSEAEFLETFAPVFLPDASAEELNQWFHAIDYNCDGRVAWDELCTFLTNSRHLAPTGGTEFFAPNPVSYEGKGHPCCITRTIVNNVSDCYYTASTDGAIRLWNPNKVTGASRIVHHCANDARIADMTWIPSLNRMLVLQTDRAVAFYDCAAFAGAGTGRGLGRSPLIKMFKGVCNLYDQVGCVDSRRNFKISKKLMAYRMVEKEKQKEGFRPDAALGTAAPRAEEDDDHAQLPLECVGTEATPLHDLGFPTAIEYAPWLGGGTMLIGTEGGYVNSYNLRKLDERDDFTSTYRPTRSRVHEPQCSITQIKAVNSLDGFISASTDETIQIYNVEKEQSYIRMRDATPVQTLPSIGKRENRAVFGFDYSPELNLLATWGENRKFIIWNPLTATSLFNRMEHTQPIQQVLFKPNHQLLTLSVDKTLKVWDTRTFQCVQTLVDKQSRVRDDCFKSMAWDSDRKTIVTGNTSPVLFRLRSVQEQLETGRTLPPRHIAGHVQSIIALIWNPQCGHVISVDKDAIITWEIATGKQISMWFPDFLQHGRHKITTACMCSGMRRLLVLTDRGAVFACNYLIDRVLHVYRTAVREEMNVLRSFVVATNMACEESVILAAGMTEQVCMFRDDPKARGIGLETPRPACILSLERHGYAASMYLEQPNRLLIGTTKGYLLIFNASSAAMTSKYIITSLPYGLVVPKPTAAARVVNIVTEEAARGGMQSQSPSRRWSRAVAERGPRPLEDDAAAKGDAESSVSPSNRRRLERLNSMNQLSVTTSLEPGSLASPPGAGRHASVATERGGGAASPAHAAASALRRRTSINPATIFAEFTFGQPPQDAASVEEQVTRGADLAVDALVSISAFMAATLQGNGDVRIWKLQRDSYKASPVYCFPGSRTAKEPARCLLYSTEKQLLYVGDSDGYVSAFDVTRCQRFVEREEIFDRRERDALPSKDSFSPVNREPRRSESPINRPIDGPSPAASPRPLGQRASITALLKMKQGLAKKKSKNQFCMLRDVADTLQGQAIELKTCFRAHRSAVTTLETCKSPHGQVFVVTGGGDGRLKLWTHDGLHVASFGHMGAWTSVFRKIRTWRGRDVDVAAPARKGEDAGAQGDAAASPTSPSRGRLSMALSEGGVTSPLSANDAAQFEREPDTRDEAMEGHAFNTVAMRCAAKDEPQEQVTTLGDVLLTRMGIRPQPESPSSSPTSKSPLHAASTPTDEQRNMQRMLNYAQKRVTHNPEMQKNLQHIESQDAATDHDATAARAALEGRIAVTLAKAKQRQHNKNPSSSQYSSLRLPQPNLGLRPNVRPFKPGKHSNLIDLMGASGTAA